MVLVSHPSVQINFDEGGWILFLVFIFTNTELLSYSKHASVVVNSFTLAFDNEIHVATVHLKLY